MLTYHQENLSRWYHTNWKFKQSKYLNSSKIIVNESIVKKGEHNFFVVRDNTTNWQSQLGYEL